MVLILSKDEYEFTTEDVIDWLVYYGTPFRRLNGEDSISSTYTIEINNANGTTTSGVLNPEYENIAIWYRRWYDIDGDDYLRKKLSVFKFKDGLDMHNHLSRELSRVNDLFWSQLPPEKFLDHPRDISLNKLTVLKLAIKNGLNVPKTLITTSAAELRSFIRQNSRVITKPIGEVLFLEYKEHTFMTLTQEVTSDIIDREHFFPTLFQEAIDKKYELRVFILDDQLYSMAIFSQNDDQTKVDFRKYNTKKMNRYVPYNLPKEIGVGLLSLMKDLNLKCGSLDLIVSNENKYYFLEVNPIGQLAMVSKNCNYPLEQYLAQYLIKLQYA